MSEMVYYWGFITTGVIVAGVVLALAWALRNDRAKSGAITIRMNGDYEFCIEDGTVTRRLIEATREMNAFGLDSLTLKFVEAETWEARFMT